MIAFTFNEMNPADPNLPANAAGDMNSLSAGTTIITCSKDGAIKQIRDERGRILLSPDGKLNRNKSTVIPNATVFIPYTANSLRKARGSQGEAQLPIYIFNHSKGKNLIVDFASSTDVAIQSFSRGTVNIVNARSGRFALANILKPEHTLDIINPDSMKPTSLKVIRTRQDRSEEVFDITPKGKLPSKTLKLGLDKSGSGLVVGNSGQVGLNLSVLPRQFSASGSVKTLPMKNMVVPGGKNQLLNLK
jgi:hypothetical protein